VVGAFKSAEDENGTILRLFETAPRRPTTVKVELAVMGVAFETDLKAQQIKTFFINAADKSVTETDFMEWPRS
jgi:alpha-mannosidase